MPIFDIPIIYIVQIHLCDNKNSDNQIPFNFPLVLANPLKKGRNKKSNIYNISQDFKECQVSVKLKIRMNIKRMKKNQSLHSMKVIN